ncbi:MAG: hypothetical protein QW192_07165, partial [Candidatus Caldarchaeum sp.]
ELKIKCQNCGYETVLTLDSSEMQAEIPKKLAEKCPVCGNNSLGLSDTRLLIDKLIEEADKLGVKVELISSEHEEGEMFKKAFKGIAGILRHRGGY